MECAVISDLNRYEVEQDRKERDQDLRISLINSEFKEQFPSYTIEEKVSIFIQNFFSELDVIALNELPVNIHAAMDDIFTQVIGEIDSSCIKFFKFLYDHHCPTDCLENYFELGDYEIDWKEFFINDNRG